MTSIEKFKLRPVTSLFGKKIKQPDGTSKREIELSYNLGFISYNERNVLLSFWTKKPPKIKNTTIDRIITQLELDGQIIKI